VKNFFRNTPSEKAGSVDGLNLFFGALLGANLGTMQSVPLTDYVTLVILLVGPVVALRMISTSERRAKVFIMIAIYAALIGASFVVPGFKPKGIADRDFYQLVCTLALWLMFLLMAELAPTRDEA